MNSRYSLVLSLTVLLLVAASGYAATWSPEALTEACKLNITGVVSLSGEHAWAVGDSGLILRRNQLGWSIVDALPIVRSEWDLTGVDAFDQNRIWVVGERRREPGKHQGLLLRSTDGGENWLRLSPALPARMGCVPFQAICLAGEGLGWIGAGGGLVLMTRDYGKSWRVLPAGQFSDHFQSIWAEGGDKAWACSDNNGGVARTGDGGATWETREPFPAEYNLPDVEPGQQYSRAAAALWASAFDTAYVALSEGRIAETVDGGNLWDVRAVAPKGVWFRDVWGKDRFVWAVGTSGEIYSSDDGGGLWTREFGGADFHLNDVDMLDDLSGYGWAVGTNGTILRRVPRAFPDLSSEISQPGPFVDIVWEINPEAPVDSFHLYCNYGNHHEDPNGYLATIYFVPGLAGYRYTDMHQYAGPCRYFYRVTTFYADGQIDTRGPLSVQARGLNAPELPPSPDNVLASRTPEGVLLTWGPTGSHTYRVYRSAVCSGPFSHIGETNQSHYLDTEVDEAATCFYLLRAAGAELTSPDSPLASVGPQEESFDVCTQVDAAGTYYDVADRIAYFSWDPVSDHMLGGYWVSLNENGSVRTLMNSSALLRDWYSVKYPYPLSATERLHYGVLPMDRISRLSCWHDYHLPVGVCNTSREDATAWNNAARLLEHDGVLHLLYSDRVGEKDRVYYTCSNDGGLHWSQPSDLGEGISPALAANFSGIYSVWLDQDSRCMTYARRKGEEWEKAPIFETSDWITPPSFAADEGNGFVAATIGDSVCWGRFSLHHIGEPEWHTIGGVAGSTPGLRASIDLDCEGSPHVAYSCSDGEVYYWSKYTNPASMNISRSTGISRYPALDVDGSAARVVWEEQLGSEWVVKCWQLFEVPDTSLWEVSCVGECGPGNSSLQPTIRGNRILWMKGDEGSSSRTCAEVYGSSFRYDSTFTWEEPQNYSQLWWSPSVYPQMCLKTRKLIGVWTEGVSPHNWVRFEEIAIPDRSLVFHKFGGVLPSAITVARDGWLWYGDRAYTKVDYSGAELTYKVEGLEPDSTYAVGMGFYQEEEPVSQLAVYADGMKLASVQVVAAELSYVEKTLPLSTTCDGEVTVGVRNLSGGVAVASHLSIDCDFGAGSGSQSGAVKSKANALDLSIDLAPNPFRKSVRMLLGVPAVDGSCSVLICDAAGRLVRRFPVNANTILWDGTDARGRALPSGVYFASLSGSERTECVKVMKLD